MPLTIRPEQFLAFGERKLQSYAAEAARTLAAVVADQRTSPAQPPTQEFVLQQFGRARSRGFTRRNELMAWTLCALVHGREFEQMPQVAQIIADRHYDRAMMLTLLAISGLDQKELAQ